MTEDEWNTSQEPLPLLLWLHQREKLTDRKARLFAAACCRRITHLVLKAKSAYRAVIIAELMAEGETVPEELPDFADRLWTTGFDLIDGYKQERRNRMIYHASKAALYAMRRVDSIGVCPLEWQEGVPDVLGASSEAAWAAAHWQRKHNADAVKQQAYRRELTAQVSLVHDIFGNPFHSPPRIDSGVLAWNNGTVERLAEASYLERDSATGNLDNTRLAIMADALEEGGIVNAAILGHLRGPGPHVRGCHVVDLLLGKG
jgi:hypothetical protein